jgi:hypothetical protein
MATADAIDRAKTGGSKGQVLKKAMDDAFILYKNAKQSVNGRIKSYNARYKFNIKSVHVVSSSNKIYYELYTSEWLRYQSQVTTLGSIVYGFPEGSVYNQAIAVSTSLEVSGIPTKYYMVVDNVYGAKKEVKNPGDAMILRVDTKSYEWRAYNSFLAAEAKYKTAKKIYDDFRKKYFPVTPLPKNGGGGGDNKDNTTNDYVYAYNDQDLKYNLGAVKYQYFKDFKETITSGGQKGLQYTPGGNAPTFRIKNGQEAFSSTEKIWANGNIPFTDALNGSEDAKWFREVETHASKGIIQSMVKPKTIGAQQNTSGGVALSPEQATKLGKEMNPHRMGFQFHYNPANFTITWQGSPNVDIATVMGGADKFGPIGAASGTGSGFSISVPLNRMADMQFVNQSESTWYTIPWRNLYGVDVNPPNVTGPVQAEPTWEDLRKIRDLGTMYDVEFLLQTVLGYKLKSGIRLGKNQLTADLGYLGGFPVEVHLGKNMRYYASITGITVYHSIFTKDMVPMVSAITINCARIPDYSPAARNA